MDFTAELPSGPLFVRTDPVRLRQIIDNLAENALRVTPAGRPIVVAVAIEGAWAATTVRDGGPGLSEDDRRVAFEPAALHARYRGVRSVGSGRGWHWWGGCPSGSAGSPGSGRHPEGGAAFTVPVAAGAAGGDRGWFSGRCTTRLGLGIAADEDRRHRVTVLDDILAGVRSDVDQRMSVTSLEELKERTAHVPHPRDAVAVLRPKG